MPTQTQTVLLDAVDRVFDLAEQTLAAQRQLARTLIGAAERQADADKPKAGKQEPKVDRRPFEERSLEELRERARELDIEGRSAMSKDELVTALRKQSK